MGISYKGCFYRYVVFKKKRNVNNLLLWPRIRLYYKSKGLSLCFKFFFFGQVTADAQIFCNNTSNIISPAVNRLELLCYVTAARRQITQSPKVSFNKLIISLSVWHVAPSLEPRVVHINFLLLRNEKVIMVGSFLEKMYTNASLSP